MKHNQHHRVQQSADDAARAQAWQQAVLDDLEQFRDMWWENHRWGFRADSELRFPAMLQPMNHEAAVFAREDAYGHYFCPFIGHADLKLTWRLYRDTAAAIDAAREAFEQNAGRKSKGGKRYNRLVSVLRERDGDGCYICGHELSDDCTIEHKLALANGGTWALENLALAHRECNFSVGRLPPEAKEAVRSIVRAREFR